MPEKKGIYHNCYQRNNDGTRVMIDWENSEQCLTGGTSDPFWARKLHNKLTRNRKSKKLLTKT